MTGPPQEKHDRDAQDRRLSLSHGVAKLHSWYQVAGLAGVLLLMWYSEEVSATIPPYQDFHDVFLEPVFLALRIDMYLSSDYREVFGGLLLRHKMLMILQSVALCIIFVLLRKFISVVSREEESLLEQITSSQYARHVITALDVTEVLLVVQNFATREVLKNMVPRLDKTMTENIYAPVLKWGWLLTTWWVAHIVSSSLLAMVYRIGVLVWSGMYSPGKYGVRPYFVAFLVCRVIVAMLWWRISPDDPSTTTSNGTFVLLLVKTVVINGIINLQGQKEAFEASSSGIRGPESPGNHRSGGQHHHSLAAKTSAFGDTVNGLNSTTPQLEGVSSSELLAASSPQRCVPWNREEAGMSRMVVVYLGRFRAILFGPLILVMGSLILILTPNTLALLVVILFLYLGLIWVPAAVLVLSTDFFVNTAGMAGFTWFVQYSDGQYSTENALHVVLLSGTVLTCYVAFSYAWRSLGYLGVAACLGLLALSVSDLVYSPDILIHITLEFGVLWLVLAVLFQQRLPTLFCLFRSLAQSVISFAMITAGLTLSYAVPHYCLPNWANWVAHTVVVLVALLLLGIVKDKEAGARSLIDKFLFNIHPGSMASQARDPEGS
eukprot:TRINITY_DN37123_c0_g1_i1.p1 TRINITY_DN37123_c0_g1~~TRINITY_DN37123_c0_g1_i1.p1  ORF type:complete len:605 (+),score=221.69 TRINITY_DN37123_c0_g1_i1:137-1951(+)